ncbi:MAG: MarR family winged helix-turn-helix transcriptional regulator [Bacillota bacterium]|jgi:DNA-binding MarR family transcriptional regulator
MVKPAEAKELHLLLFSFLGIFHKKFLLPLRRRYDYCLPLKKNQGKVLHVLYQFDRLTPTELSKMLDIEKGSLTTVVNRLVEMGMVTRSSDPTDRRRVLLSLSSRGREKMERVMQKHLHHLMHIFRDVEQEDMERFFANLRNTVEFMKKL